MVMIASYFARVGVDVDRSSLTNVNKVLTSIEKRMRSFQTSLSRTSTIDVRVNFNTRDFRERLNRLFRGNGGANRTVAIDLRISQRSLTSMRGQIQSAINGLIVSPTINPRIRQPRVVQSGGGQGGGRGGAGGRGTGGGGGRSHTTQNPTSNRTHNPWHNPMMVGGGVGAFMRYGAYSLPLVAGSMGLNALSKKSAMLQSQDMALDVSVGAMGSPGESQKYKDFLNDLGDRLGRTTSSMTPFFAQMLAGAKGTALEPHLESGFSSLMQFGSVMGLNDEAMKGTIKAFSQMIGKQQIMA